jgi:hypothetical protein
VFFSTASDGSVLSGLGGVPDLNSLDGRAILFVGNHQLIGRPQTHDRSFDWISKEDLEKAAA